jgi:hypothetical protein
MVLTNLSPSQGLYIKLLFFFSFFEESVRVGKGQIERSVSHLCFYE